MAPVAEEVGGRSETAQQSAEAPEEDAPAQSVVRKKVPRSCRMDQYSTDKGAAKEFFKKEPCLYTHRMFDRAAKIFHGLKLARQKQLEKKSTKKPGGKGVKEEDDGPTIPPMDFKGPTEKKLTFELAFASLKYNSVFDDMLDDCAFFSLYSNLRDSEALVMVVLWDYQSRKFQPRVPHQDEELLDSIKVIERAILEQKTKLAASLARRRIKASAPNIEYLLPDNVRRKSSVQQPMPVFAWVNTLKIQPMELLQKLKEEGFVQLWAPPEDLKNFKEKSFFMDPHCSDVLVFSLDCNSLLQEHPLIEQGYLVRQDKSSCLGAMSVIPLLGDEQDVVVVNPGAGLVPAHLAGLLKERKCNVVVVSEHKDDEHNKMLQNIELLGATKYVRVIRDKFTEMAPDDYRLRSVRAALVIAECSKSAINNVVNFVVTEGENLKLLQDMSNTTDDLEERLNRLQANHVNLLRQALKLNKIQGVAYMTRSVHELENDLVVQRAIEYVNTMQMARKYQPWRVIPPVLPFSAEEIDEQVGIEGKYTMFRPTVMTNGCFIAAIAREPEDPVKIVKTKGKAVSGRGSGTKLKATTENGETPVDAVDSARPRKRSLGDKKKAGKGNVSNSAARRRASTRGGGKASASSSSTDSGKAAAAAAATDSAKLPEHMKVVKHPAPFR